MLSNAQILFPNDAISSLRTLRGEAWAKLIDHILTLPDDHPDVCAFVLLMFRINGCLNCEIDSFRALKGCQACSLIRLKRFKGSEQDLLNRYQKALTDIQQHQGGITPTIPAAA